MLKINRRPGTQDISWFLDQHRLGRLDLEPPYQRRSVWTPKDRRYFLDTLFRGYPCPPIYLHKAIDHNGSAIFHVVAGKQRLETLIRFADNKLRIPDEYGDDRLNNKRWKDVIGDTTIRNQFLNYPFVVEYFDDVDSSLVNEVFERMNKNSRKLTQQELRNARYDGWFSNIVDNEAKEPIWKRLGLVTTGRARRMADVQFIAEMFMVIIQKQIIGFDHNSIDKFYADYEEVEESDLNFDEENFTQILGDAREYLTKMHESDSEISSYLSSVSNMYSLWAVLVLDMSKLPPATILARRYMRFMSDVYKVGELRKSNYPNADQSNATDSGLAVISEEAVSYFDSNQSATTELPQRQTRLASLRKALQNEG